MSVNTEMQQHVKNKLATVDAYHAKANYWAPLFTDDDNNEIEEVKTQNTCSNASETKQHRQQLIRQFIQSKFMKQKDKRRIEQSSSIQVQHHTSYRQPMTYRTGGNHKRLFTYQMATRSKHPIQQPSRSLPSAMRPKKHTYSPD
jgi:hypothetical protein